MSMKGAHVMRHTAGSRNGLWSYNLKLLSCDIEKKKTGLNGITLKSETLKTWALSLHLCGQILEDLSTLRESEELSKYTQHTQKKL